jgi:saccharopine dehydrogenase-like NADP-dependent oxidoreductase
LKSRYRYFDVAAHLHIEVARDCVVYKKTWLPLLMLRCKNRRGCKENNLIFMNEIGLDPGVDHMSAMKVIDEISDKGGKCFYLNPLWGSCCPRVRYQSLEL